LKSSNKPDDLIEIGKIVGAHGIRGAVKVYSYAESPECFTGCGDLIIVDPRGNRQRWSALWAKPHKNMLRLALKSVESRDDAEALAGHRIFIPRACLPPLEDDTYYWVDLIGMTVCTTGGETLGVVAEIIRTGANDVYVVEPGPDRREKEILIPAIELVVVEVDIDSRRMRVELPDGLIDPDGGR
jgi:16S rRNA processing protein RimM